MTDQSQTVMAKQKIGTSLGPQSAIGKQLVEVANRAMARQLSHFSTAFPKRIPLAFPFPSKTEATTMADAAEHDEELVDYDEEEVG